MAGEARDQLLQKITDRAVSDPAFRQELLQNPRAAFEKATGVKIPADVEVVAHEDTPRKLNISVPMASGGRYQHSLTDDQLDAVAGGVSWGCGEYGP